MFVSEKNVLVMVTSANVKELEDFQVAHIYGDFFETNLCLAVNYASLVR